MALGLKELLAYQGDVEDDMALTFQVFIPPFNIPQHQYPFKIYSNKASKLLNNSYIILLYKPTNNEWHYQSPSVLRLVITEMLISIIITGADLADWIRSSGDQRPGGERAEDTGD